MKVDGQTTEGVLIEQDGKYWGILHSDAQCTCYGFGGIDTVKIASPEFVVGPESMVPPKCKDEVKGARLMKVTKKVTYEIEEL